MSAYSKEFGVERLLQLSHEADRIAATLARLSTASAPAANAPQTGDPEVSRKAVAAVIHARRLRSFFFPDDLFADPAWDMMLELLQAKLAGQSVSVSSLCTAAAVPATTALRWLKALVERGLFIRHADPHDGRRVFVELAPEASAALRRYFAEVAEACGN